ALLVEADHLAQVFRDIDDQRLADRLAALRGPGAARQQRRPAVARDVDDQRQILLVARHDDAQRLDLVDRGIGRIAAASRAVEQHVAADRAPQRLLKAGQLTSLPLIPL